MGRAGTVSPRKAENARSPVTDTTAPYMTDNIVADLFPKCKGFTKIIKFRHYSQRGGMKRRGLELSHKK
jgi:hypothetical protein